ncbi:zinc finger and BTB domain-containing protein 2-like [Sinocyclocheilus grahami]|uniref:Zinc finger and BTB domain-containing protein 2-like n=1 Tax=Sinocyclocheilus grahami TaxID=75366 RepID=A0A672S8E7_SINGR|nr:PREDICTED: zinc finger and BTB domain-containing protein 2-like [Sinocyclocheilus grahami]
MDLAHHGLVLLKRLNAQREFGFLCDCTVAIGDVLFKAHKAVLAAFSNYFRMLFIHQDSNCVRLRPSDIQADIFSYLLNLMYTGKFTTQPIDPLRLEQGVKFLHAYPLLQEASLLINPESQCVPLTNSLYGIQIPDQTYSRPERNTACKDGIYAKNSENVNQTFLEISDMDYRSLQPVGIESPTQNPAATMFRHLTYGITSKSASSRKHYTCNYCGIRFNQRCKLKEHLRVHTNQATEPQVLSMQNGHTIELEVQDMEEDHLRVDSDVISDTDQQAWMEDTPPPSEMADIDNLEGTEMGREMKRRKFECPTCARKFIQKSHWREHMYIHTGKPYKCSACGKNFCRANQAARHVCLSQDTDSYIMVNKQSLVLCGGEDNSQVEALFQSSERPYKCSMCAAPFASPSEVPKHQCLTESDTVPLAENSLGENQKKDLETTIPEVTIPS